MNDFMSNEILLTILTFSILLIALLGWVFRKGLSYIQQPLTIVSSAMVCGIVFMHIFPELFAHGGTGMGIALLSGVFLQLIIERMTGGFEHGHGHLHGSGKGMVVGLMVGLFIHAFVEGTPLLVLGNEQASSVLAENIHVHNNDHEGHGHAIEKEHNHQEHNHQEHDHATCSGHHDNHNQGDLQGESNEELEDEFRLTVFTAIISHNIPITVLLIALFLNLGYTFKRTFSFVVLFAAAAPLGAILGFWLLTLEGFANMSMYLIAISTGMLLHIITHILTEQGHGNKTVSLPIQAGSLLMGLILVVLLFGW
jgi:hypothetical protein